MGKLIKIILVLSILMFAMSCASNHNPNDNGNLEPEINPDPNDSIIHEIHNAEDLILLSAQTENFRGETIRFINDIDMENKPFNGIAQFAGTMDGNGKKIKKLTIDKPYEESVGLIFDLQDGAI